MLSEFRNNFKKKISQVVKDSRELEEEIWNHPSSRTSKHDQQDESYYDHVYKKYQQCVKLERTLV